MLHKLLIDQLSRVNLRQPISVTSAIGQPRSTMPTAFQRRLNRNISEYYTKNVYIIFPLNHRNIVLFMFYRDQSTLPSNDATGLPQTRVGVDWGEINYALIFILIN